MATSYASLIDFASSWANIDVTVTPFGGTALTSADVSSLSHSGTVTVGEQKSGGKVVARTSGSVKYEAKIKFYRGGLRRFKTALVAIAPEYAKRGNQILISRIGFDIDVQHSPPGADRIFQNRIKGCRLLGYTDDMSEGDDADQIELDLSPIENVEIIDGKELVLL